MSHEPRLSQVLPQHLAAAVTLGLVADRDGCCDAAGSAVLIAPGWAVTARHVIDGYHRSFEGNDWQPGVNHAKHRLLAIQMKPYGVQVFRVLHAAEPCLPSDLALLRVEPVVQDEAFRWPSLTIDIIPPLPGTLIRSFGFRGKPIVEFSKIVNIGALVCSIGTVAEVIEKALSQRVTLPYGFPCAVSDAHVDGGMSGGPVFSDEGSLLGVWSSSTLHSSGQDTSTFALIWPLLSATMAGSLDAEAWTIERSVYRAAQMGVINIPDIHCFELHADEQGHFSGTFRVSEARRQRSRAGH